MGYSDYKQDLVAPDFDADRILNRYFHCGQSAVFQGAHPEEEPDFKRDLALVVYQNLGVRLHPLQLVVCGSAHLGFSPVPDKLGKPFHSDSSDIDVAIISPELFDSWWAELHEADLPFETRRTIADDLFWGFINPANVHAVSKIGRNWWSSFRKVRTERANGVRGRVYRTFWFMQSYHRLAIEQGRAKLCPEQSQTE